MGEVGAAQLVEGLVHRQIGPLPADVLEPIAASAEQPERLQRVVDPQPLE
jgi:hypothetical protein